MSKTTLEDFAEDGDQDVFAWAFEVAKFSVFEDSERNIVDWHWQVRREKPSADNWNDEGVTEHRIRNVTPLVPGAPDAPEDEALAFYYTYSSALGEKTQTTLDTEDPRGADALIRCTPLVPADRSEKGDGDV